MHYIPSSNPNVVAPPNDTCFQSDFSLADPSCATIEPYPGVSLLNALFLLFLCIDLALLWRFALIRLTNNLDMVEKKATEDAWEYRTRRLPILFIWLAFVDVAMNVSVGIARLVDPTVAVGQDPFITGTLSEYGDDTRLVNYSNHAFSPLLVLNSVKYWLFWLNVGILYIVLHNIVRKSLKQNNSLSHKRLHESEILFKVSFVAQIFVSLVTMIPLGLPSFLDPALTIFLLGTATFVILEGVVFFWLLTAIITDLGTAIDKLTQRIEEGKRNYIDVTNNNLRLDEVMELKKTLRFLCRR